MAIVRRPVTAHLIILLSYIGVGVAVTWPHATYLTGRLPATRDAGSYVWGFWWVARSVVHLSDPWHTTYLAAPVGTDLGMHALMPLVGLIMTPVTLVFGPSASYTVLSVIMPGLLAYAMYRVARLWVPSQIGAIAAGAFYGYSSLLDFQSWVHLNLAAGALFLPMTLEAAVRLRRRPGPGQAIVLGIVLGASLLVDQESAVLALIVAMLAIGSWLLPSLVRRSRETAPSPSGTPPEPVSQRASWLSRLRPARPRQTRPRQAGFRRAKLRRAKLRQAGFRRARLRQTRPRQAGFRRARPRRARLRPARLRPARPGLPAAPTSPLPRRLLARPRLRRRPESEPRRFKVHWLRFVLAAIAGATAIAVAAPQIVAIVHANAAGSPSATLNASSYLEGIKLPDLFLPSPRVASFGLGIGHAEDSSTFGFIPSVLALVGLLLAWRRRSAWKLAGLWLTAAALAIGADLILPGGTATPLAQAWDGVRVSLVLPYTWFIRIPGLIGFREPSRIAELGLVSIALLAGYTVDWLRQHAKHLLVVVLVLGVFEAGLTTPPRRATTMPTGLPALDNPIAADHSSSVVVDVPFGLRGGTGVTGLPFPDETQVLATADQHPLADALLSRVPTSTAASIDGEPFYHDLIREQTGHHDFTPEQLIFAGLNARRMHIGWVVLWVSNKHLRQYLLMTGFDYAYRADHASVWRPSRFWKDTPRGQRPNPLTARRA
ncbi:MAG TPA: hypothetical protein VFQ44_15565 [Streptosporangiaceae bacterium]|nr:hypothetical protein [Streptosporangiaceae bacterium]